MEPLIGLVSTPDVDGNLARCREELSQLGATLGFRLAVPDRTVASLQEATTAARALAGDLVDYVLILCNGFTPDGDLVLPFSKLGVPLGLWALPEPVLEGSLRLTSLVDLNLFASILARADPDPDRSPKWFLGYPEERGFQQRFDVTVRALRLRRGLGGATIGFVGGHAPGYSDLDVDHRILQDALGIRVEMLPLAALLSEATAVSDSQAEAAGQELAKHAGAVCCEGADVATSGRIVTALSAFRERHRLSAFAIACWPRFYEELGAFPCVAYGTLNSEGCVIACEGDVLGAVTLLALSLAGDSAPTLADMVAVVPDENAICFWHCGLAAWNWANEQGVKLISRPVPGPGGTPRSAGGFADLTFAESPATIVRFTRDGTQLLVAGAQTTSRLGRGYEGSGGWFTGLHMGHAPVTPTQFLDTVVRFGVEHHFGLAQGDISDALTEWARWSSIRLLEARSANDHI